MDRLASHLPGGRSGTVAYVSIRTCDAISDGLRLPEVIWPPTPFPVPASRWATIRSDSFCQIRVQRVSRQLTSRISRRAMLPRTPLLPGRALGGVKLRTTLDNGGPSRRVCSSLGATPPWCISPSLSLRDSSCSRGNRIRAFQTGLKRLSPNSRAEPSFQSPVCMGRPAAAAPC